MKKRLTILSILFFAFLMTTPFNTTKAINNINNATTSVEFENRIFTNYKHQNFKHKPTYFYYPYLNYTKDKNGIEFFKDIIESVIKNLLGITFFVFIILYVLFYLLSRLPHNRKIIKKYKRENGDNDKKFVTMRCKEDGDEKRRHYVYLINENDKTYQWLEDDYTIKKLGYGYASRKDNLFSKKGYTIKERIKIYYNIFDIKVILEILKFKNN